MRGRRCLHLFEVVIPPQCPVTASEGLLAEATQAPLANTKMDPATERTSSGVPRSVTWKVVAKMICCGAGKEMEEGQLKSRTTRNSHSIVLTK